MGENQFCSWSHQGHCFECGAIVLTCQRSASKTHFKKKFPKHKDFPDSVLLTLTHSGPWLLNPLALREESNNVSRVKFSQQVELQTGLRPGPPLEAGQGSDGCCRGCPRFDPLKKKAGLFHAIAAPYVKITPQCPGGCALNRCPHTHKCPASLVPAFEREMLELQPNVSEHMQTRPVCESDVCDVKGVKVSQCL